MDAARRPRVRLMFDELLPYRAALALRELQFRTSHVGHKGDRQPDRGSDDEKILRHAMRTKQVVVTSNHDMIMLCNELQQPVGWIDPRGRQYRADELAMLALGGIAEWERLLARPKGPFAFACSGRRSRFFPWTAPPDCPPNVSAA